MQQPVSPAPPKKKSHFKRILLIAGLLILALVLTAIVIAGFFQEAVGRKLIGEINKQLKTELKVGSFDLSLLRGFPDATASLRDVTMMGLNEEPLLDAKEMAFHFRLLSLFGSSVKVHSVTIRNGALSIATDKAGKANYDIFKPSKSKSAGFSISLEKARLENIELAYRNEKIGQEILMLVQEADFSGELSSERYDLKSTAKLVSNFVDMDGVRYFAGKKWGYEAALFVDVNKGRYDFNKVVVNVEDNTFNVAGYLQSGKKGTDFDLEATAEDANLESVVALMPEQYLASLGDFSSTGRFHFDASVKGRLSATERPAIRSEVSLDDGKVISPRLQEPFKDVSFRMTFDNAGGQNSAAFFEISDFKGYLNRELLTLSLKVENLDDPHVDFLADGIIPMGYVYGLFDNPAITAGDGEVEFKNLEINGLYRDMTDVSNIINVLMSGEITFDDAQLTVNGETVQADMGNLRFQNNALTLENLKLVGAGSEINLKGSVQNLLPVLFADSLNSQNAELLFSGELFSPNMDVSRLIKLTDVPVKEGEVKEAVFDSLQVTKNEQRRRITDFLKGTFNLKVDDFRYNDIEGQFFAGDLTFENRQMRISGSANGMDGIFNLDGVLYFDLSPRLEAKLDCQKIDVKAFFRQTNNIGQTYLTHENIAGSMNSKMLIHAFWDSTGHFQMDKLHVWAGLGIHEGELKGFKLLEEFSTYAKIQDLRNVRFVDMQNWLEVKNSTFYMPAMFLQNNAMNLTIAGEQTFDDRIDYGIKVNAGQVLANKFKKHNSKLDPIPAKENGFFNLYFSITGTIDDYKYETNKRKVKAQFERSERQKAQIRSALIKAFGAPLNMLREPKGWEDKGEPSASHSDDDVEYIEGF